MEFKKIAGYLLAVLTLCSTATVSESADISDEASLTQLLTVDGGDGTVINSLATTNAIDASVNVVLHSSAGNKFNLSGEAINIAATNSLSLYDISVSNTLNFITDGVTYPSLVIGNTTSETQGVNLGGISGAANILISSAKPVFFGSTVTANSITIDSNSTSAIGYTGDVLLSASYAQNAGIATLSDAKTISAKNVELNGGELILSATSNLKATDVANGNVVVNGGKINSTSGSKNGMVTAATGYQQTGVGSNVNIDTLNVNNGSVALSGGSLTLKNLGTSAEKISGDYSQTAGTLVVDDAYVAGDVSISGGQATVNNSMSTDGYILVNGGTFTLADGTSSDFVQVNVADTFKAQTGSLNIGDNAVLTVNKDVELKTTTNIGDNSKITSTTGSITVDGITIDNANKNSVLTANQSYIQKGTASKVTLAEIKAADVDIQGGSLNLKTIGSNVAPISGAYTQSGATTEVTVDNLYTTGNINLNAGKFNVNGNLSTLGNITNANTTLNIDATATAGGTYSQTGGHTTLANNKTLTAKNINISGGNFVLGKDAQISTNSQDVTVSSNSTITNTDATGTITSARDYLQSGTSQVTTKVLGATNDVTLSGGTLNVSTVSSGADLTVSGGTLSATTTTAGADLLVSNGTLNSTNTSAGNDLIVSGGTLNTTSGANAVNSLQMSSGKIVSGGNLTAGTGIALTGGELQLGSSSNTTLALKSNTGNISVQNAKINATTGNKFGIVQAVAGDYLQSGTSNVSVNEIYAQDVNVSGGSLTSNLLGSNISADKMLTTYTQGGNTTQVTTGALYTSGNIDINGGSLSSGDIISSSGTYSQTAGNVTVADTKAITANVVNLAGGSISLGNNSNLKSKTGNITVENATINDVNKTATMTSAGKYIQTGSSNVAVNKLLSAGDVSVQGGSLNVKDIGSEISLVSSYSQSGTSIVNAENLFTTGTVNVTGGDLTIKNIGSDTSRIASYTQSGNADVSTDYIYTADSTGDVSISGGSFTLNKGASVGGDFTVSGAATKFINNASESNFNVDGTFSQQAGTTTVVGDNKTISAESYTVASGSTLELLKNASVIVTESFNVNGGTVSDQVDGGNNSGTINAGKLYVQTGDTANVNVNTILANSTNGAVRINGGTLNAVNIGTASNKINTYTQTAGSVNSSAINATGKVDISQGSLDVTSIGKADGKIGEYSQSGGMVDTQYIYSTGDVTFSGGSFASKTGGVVSTDSNIVISGVDTGVDFNGNVSAQTYKQTQATVDVIGSNSKITTATSFVLDNNANLNLASGATIATTGGLSNISVTGDSKIVGGDGIIDAANNYSQSGANTSVSVRNLNAAGTVEIGTSTTSGGIFNAKAIGSDLISPLAYRQYGSTVTVDNMYVGNNGIVLSSDSITPNGVLKVNKSLSSLGDVIINGSSLSVTNAFKSSGDLHLNEGNLSLNGDSEAVNYIQQGGVATIATGKTLTLTEHANISSGEFVLNNNSSLKTSGDVSVTGNASLNSTIANLNGTITTSGKYTQSTSGDVYLSQIVANNESPSVDSGVNINGNGSLTITNIGTTDSDKKVGYYTQGSSGAPTVIANQIQSTGDVKVMGGTLQVEKIGVNDEINSVKSYSQGGTTSQVTVGSGGIVSAGDVAIYGEGVLSSNGNIISKTGSYSQSGTSEVTLYGSKKILSKENIALSEDATLNLGNSSTIESNASMTVSDSAKIIDSSNTGTIKLEGGYLQNGQYSNINAKELLVKGNVDVNAGSLTVGNIGGSAIDKKVTTYTQGTDTTSATVVVDNIYSRNDLILKNGSLTAKNTLNADKIISIEGDEAVLNLAVNSKVTASDAYRQSAGKVNVASGAEINATKYINLAGGEVTLADNSKIVTTDANANIEVNGTAKINATVPTNMGTINAGNSYVQEGVTSIYVDKLFAKQKVNVKNGTLSANTIGSEDNNVNVFELSGSEDDSIVSADTLYAKTISVSGGTLNIGDLVTPQSILSGNSINLSAGIINLYNTTVEASSIAPAVPNSSAFTADGSIVNVLGNNNLGSYGTDSNIYSATIGGTKNTTLNIGNKDAITDSLNVSAGKGNFVFGANSILNIANDGVINLTAKEGNIDFATGSKISNEGNINILIGGTDKTVKIDSINDVDNAKGNIAVSGDTIISGKIYTDKYTQAAGKTTLSANSLLSAANANDAILLSGGTLALNGNNINIEAKNGKFSTQNVDTVLIIEGGTGSTISAKEISIADTNLTLNENTDLTFVPDSTGIKITSSNTTLKQGSTLTINTEKGAANITGGEISVGEKASVNINGNTLFTGVNTELEKDSSLNLDSSNGAVTIDSTSVITNNSGNINVSGAENSVVISADINSDTNKNGNIVKTGKNSLDLNGEVYANNLTVSEGTVNINENVNLKGAVKFEGNTENNQSVLVNIAEGKALSTEGDITVGSITNYQNTTMNLGANSTLSGLNVNLNAIINAVKANIVADVSKGGNVTIGEKTNLTVSHYAPDGDDTTISTISGNLIKIYGGSNITIQDGAELVFAGIVQSQDAHYDVQKGAQWLATGGEYSNALYVDAPGGGVLTNAGDVTLDSNVIFSNTIASQHGGAVHNTGNLKAKYDTSLESYVGHIQFNGNKAGYNKDGSFSSYKDQNGGAIFNGIASDGNNGVVLLGGDTTFSKNVASGAGGAIYNISAGQNGEDAVTIGSKALFSENKAVNNGGAIYAGGVGTVKIGSESTFESNMAGFKADGSLTNYSNGGAIFVDTAATVSLSPNTVFKNNIASENGGAIANYGNLVFDGSTITKNQINAEFIGNGVQSSVTDPTKLGGAIYNTGVITSIDEGGNSINGLYKVNFGSSVAGSGNKAQYGGAIYNNNTGSNVFEIKESLFQNNVAVKDGGAIYNNDGTMSILQGTKFYSNTASENGGAIYNNDDLKVSYGVEFGAEKLGNIANNGGAIYNNGSLTFDANKDNRINFTHNTAKEAGGAIYNNGTINSVAGSNILSFVDFNSNIAGSVEEGSAGKGGAIYNANGSLEINNSEILSNKTVGAESKGGAIYNTINGVITLGEKTIVKNNQATGSAGDKYSAGGAIYNEGKLNISNDVEIQLNSTDGFGGAIFNSGETKLSDGAVIGGLMADYYGNGPATAGNQALKGGGIYNEGTLTFGDGAIYFIGNIAKEAGGALYNKSSQTFNTEEKSLIFYGNSVVTDNDDVIGLGGAIYNDKDSAQVIIKDTEFISNSADVGSAIFNAGNMYIDSSNNFEGNKVGSAIGNSGSLELSNAWEFGPDANSVPPNAGALWNQEEGVINISINPSLKDEYSIYIHDTGYVNEEGNGAVNGAALHLQDKSTINTFIDGVKNENTLTNAKLISNKGHLGGALFKSSEIDLDIKNTMFNANSAIAKEDGDNNTAAGGAIYNNGAGGAESNISIDNKTSFTSNYTTGKGGAIYNGSFGSIQFAKGYIIGEEISGYSNIAAVAGGAIANEGTMIFEIDATTDRSVYFRYQGGGRSGDTGNIYNGKGGAMYLAGDSAIGTINKEGDFVAGLTNAVFTNNESKYGGAIYKDSGKYVLDIFETQFSGNRGYLEGGAVYNNIGEMNLHLNAQNDNIFVGNQAGNDMTALAASGKGGAIYNAGVMAINNDGLSDKIFLSNTATGKDGSGGAIYNTSELTINSNVGFYSNSAVKTGGAITNAGTLKLDLSNGDIKFSQNTAEVGSAIYMNSGILKIEANPPVGKEAGTVTFVDADPENGIVAQTIAGVGENNITIRGGNVNFFSDASGYGGAYYQTGGVVTSKNKFLNITDSSIRTVTGGTLILDEGAQLMSDYLLISNIEADSNSSAKIIFNKNSKSKLTDLSALYDHAATNNYFLYGNEKDGYRQVSLRAADVEINDVAEIAQDATIGNAKNTYMVRNLTLSNGAKLGANVTVYGGTTTTDTGAKLVLNEGTIGSEKAGVALKGYNSNLEINNKTTPLLIGGKISNDGTSYNNTISKTGDGVVTITGDASGYNGKYTQSAGTVEFASGSKYFGADTTTTVTGGTLKVANNVSFEDGTVIDIKEGSKFSTALASNVDLTGASGSVLTIDDPSVTVNLAQNSTIEVTNNANVNAAKDVIRIGNENLQVNSIILGGSEQTAGGAVNVTVNPNTRFVLQNDSDVVGQGGVLGFGENVVFKDTNGDVVTPVVQLKDNTQLKFSNANNSNIAVVIQSIDDTENINQAWATANGDIVKENKGTATLTGNVSDFHGSLVVKDGEFATAGTQFASDVVYDLSQISNNANVRVKNVSSNNDIIIVGDVTTASQDAKYNLAVSNDRGNIVLKDILSGNHSNVYVKNGSVANFTSTGSTNVGNTSVLDNSVLNVANADSYNVNGDLIIKNSTVNLLSGNMNVAGNVSMGSTFNMLNGTINTQNIAGNMTLTNNSDYKIDINPVANAYDKVVIGGTLASDVAGTPRTLNISDYNLMTDPVAEYAIYNVFDVKGGVTDVNFTVSKQNVSTPIANYMFRPSGNNGSYLLARTGFTPSAMAAPVAVQIGGYLTQIASYDAAFGNLDTVMALPVVGYDNQYASSNIDETVVYSPLFIPELEKGVWFRPYGHFEKVNLDDGPEVSNQTYGALVGADTPLTELGNGFQGTLSAYVGYNGAHQTFDGISSNQNGGMIGATGAIYKGGFFSGLTINANAGFSNASTLYGNQDFFMLSAGIASKTGYNWELARGRFIIQPSWLMSYSFVKAFDDPTLVTTKLESKALHGVQIAPGIKLMANLPQGWQPYLLFNFRFNLGDKTNYTAGLIDLPETSVKPYVEYGLGMQKRWGDRFTGFGQFLARGGGRNGVGLNLGLRWNVGQGR